MKPILTFLLSTLSFISVNAQSMYYPDNSVKVFRGSVEKTLAWSGGFNNPQFSMGDLNHDGKQDLIVFEPYKGVKTFINRGGATPDYRFEPAYALNFPPIYNYLVLADYNRDNVPDLFHGGYTGFTVYKGYYDSRNQLCFNFYKELYYYNDLASGGAANAFCNPGDIPAIVDVDNDGDIDFVSYNILGGTLNYYKNLQMEDGLPTDSIRIALKDRCWGKVYQGFYRTHTLNYSCNNSGLKMTMDTAAKVTHSGNTPCLFDWDMDQDYDYLDGSVSFNEMTFLKNGRIDFSAAHDSMVTQDTMWQTGGKRVNIPVWPAAFNIDIDQDGKKDLLIAPNAPNASENYKCIWFYKNNSTAGAPNWQFVSDSFLIDKTLDLGTAAYPMLYDFNKDGKLDLLIGSEGYRQSSGQLQSKITYLKNTSTAGAPSFVEVTDNFLSIDTFHFKGIAPCFGDLDNDVREDMVLGHADGTLSFFKNSALSATAQPVWTCTQRTLKDNTGTDINVSGQSAPFIYDIDRDGRKDLIVGNMYGTLTYYRNVTTTAGSLMLQLINVNLGQVKVDPAQIIGCYSTPFIGKIDSTGKDYLLVGSNSGNLYLYDSISCGDTTLTYPLLSSQYSYIDSLYLLYNHSGSPAGLYGGLRNAPTVGDIDGDGNLEMVVGEIRGGVKFYKRKLRDNSSVANASSDRKIVVYPNPAGQVLNISIEGLNEMEGECMVSLYQIDGRLAKSMSFNCKMLPLQIPVEDLSEGLYIARIDKEDVRIMVKFTVVK